MLCRLGNGHLEGIDNKYGTQVVRAIQAGDTVVDG